MYILSIFVVYFWYICGIFYGYFMYNLWTFYLYFMDVLCIFYVYFMQSFMYILDLFYVYFMDSLCTFYVYFLYILDIFYVYFTWSGKSCLCRGPSFFKQSQVWQNLARLEFKTMCLGPLRLTPCLRNPVNSKIPCLGEASTKSPENYWFVIRVKILPLYLVPLGKKSWLFQILFERVPIH